MSQAPDGAFLGKLLSLQQSIDDLKNGCESQELNLAGLINFQMEKSNTSAKHALGTDKKNNESKLILEPNHNLELVSKKLDYVLNSLDRIGSVIDNINIKQTRTNDSLEIISKAILNLDKILNDTNKKTTDIHLVLSSPDKIKVSDFRKLVEDSLLTKEETISFENGGPSIFDLVLYISGKLYGKGPWAD